MDPRLIENSTFLRYYEKWQRDPNSIVFAAISETLRTHGMLDEAINVALEGLKHHPNLVSGRIALAKAFLARGEVDLAHKQAVTALELMPNNEEAKKLLKGRYDNLEIETEEDEITEDIPIAEVDSSWHTLTMARIYVSQGHTDKARKIYESILSREPDNKDASEELARL